MFQADLGHHLELSGMLLGYVDVRTHDDKGTSRRVGEQEESCKAPALKAMLLTTLPPLGALMPGNSGCWVEDEHLHPVHSETPSPHTKPAGHLSPSLVLVI